MVKRTRKGTPPKSQYDAAGFGRRTRGWSPPSAGPNRAIVGLPRVRDRARDSVRNDWAGAASVQKWGTTLVGIGIVPRWKNKRFQALWQRFVPAADADGVYDAYGLQTLTATSWLSAGEVFIRNRPRDISLPLALPTQAQLIESDFVPLLDTDTWPGLPAGNTIRSGIERNIFGRRTAYWMYREHPGDRPMSQTPNANDLVRVAASQVSHVYEPQRPGQLRGISPLAPILLKLRSSMDFEDAVLDRQKLANLFVSFITRQMPPWDQIDVDPDTGLPKFYDSNGQAMAGLEPGIQQELAPGESVTFANPPEAGTSYPDFWRTTHLGTASAQGLPYEFMSGDIREVSDRALRLVVNEFRRFAEQRQWQILIPMGCAPLVRWAGQAAVLAGELAPSELEEWNSPTWSPHRWEYMHPLQDAQAQIAMRDAKITSTSAIILARGEDPDEVAAQIKADEKAGLVPKPPAPKQGPAPKPGQQQPQARVNGLGVQMADVQRGLAGVSTALAELRAQQATPPAAPPTPALDEAMVHFITGLVEAQGRSMVAAVTAAADRPLNLTTQVNPTPVNVLPAPVENVVNVQPAAVENVVNVPPTVVENVVNVAPAPVDVNVNLPDRRTESEISRDLSGGITKVVMTETTVQ